MNAHQMVEKFQCPGCVCGSSPQDGCYVESNYGAGCTAHVCGTSRLETGAFALGIARVLERLGMGRAIMVEES